MLCGNVDLDFDEFLQFDGKHKRNRHCLQRKSVNYPANNFGRFNYFYRTHRIWNNLPKAVLMVQLISKSLNEPYLTFAFILYLGTERQSTIWCL